MFGWFRRRLAREHRKLAYQNFEASTDAEMPFLCTAKGFDAYQAYEEAKLFSSYCIRKLAVGEKLDTNEIDAALKINKELRRLYDQFGRNGRGAFEQVYQPLGGWGYYFDGTRMS